MSRTQLIVSMQEKVCIGWAVQDIGYIRGMSDGIRDVMQRRVDNISDEIPRASIDIEQVGQYGVEDTWIDIRLPQRLKDGIWKAKGGLSERMFILQTLREVLGYRIQDGRVILLEGSADS